MRLIDADALIGRLCSYLPRTPFITLLIGVINNEPTIEPDGLRVRGRWLDVRNGMGICSNCNRLDSVDKLATHCRYCGARMRNSVR